MIHYACDVGGTRIKLALIRDEELFARSEIAAAPVSGLAAILPRLAREWTALSRVAGLKKADVNGFALAFPGIVDPGNHRILSTPRGKFDDASGLDVDRIVQRELGLPTYIVNDANAALAGEARFGAARGCDNVVMMTLGTGIGTAVIINGVPLRGKHGQAGNLGGHLTAALHGSPCICGNVGCVETEASTWALPGQARGHRDLPASMLAQEPVLDYRAVFDCAARGDRLAIELRNHALLVWANAVVTLIHAYDPERVILGGGIMNSSAMILEFIREHVARHAWTPWGKVEVRPAALGNDAGLFGAASLAAIHSDPGRKT